MFQTIVFTPPTALAATPSGSASASGAFTLHDVTGNRQIAHAEGLIGTPAPRDVTRAIPGRDGVRDDTRYVSERLIVLEGEVWGSSQRAALDDWTNLVAAFESTLLAPGQLTITLPAGSGTTQQRWTNVVLTGGVLPAFEGGSNVVSYQATFRANDPRWFAITKSTDTLTLSANGTSTTNTVTAAGTAPAYPIFTWSASAEVSNVTVNVPSPYAAVSPQGSAIVLGQTGSTFSVTSSSSVDCNVRTATLGTNKLTARTQWPILYPGSSTWNFTRSSGSTVTTTMSWYDAWW